MGIKLVGVSGPMRGKGRDLPSGTYTIGRGSHCDVPIEGDENVSREHAVLHIMDGVAEIEDVGSKNGTWVNESPVLKEEVLDGDLLKIGDSVFRVKNMEEASAKPTVAVEPPRHEPRFAGFWVRVAAEWIDGLVVGLPLVLFFNLIVLIAPSVAEKPGWWFVGAIFALVVIATYYTLMDGTTGQTIGRRATRIRVVSTSMRQISQSQALTRLLIYWGMVYVGPLIIWAIVAAALVISSVGNLYNLDLGSSLQLSSRLGFVTLLIVSYMVYYHIILAADGKKCGWHDVVSGTVVVHMER